MKYPIAGRPDQNDHIRICFTAPTFIESQRKNLFQIVLIYPNGENWEERARTVILPENVPAEYIARIGEHIEDLIHDANEK